jgi:hypothetical protein
MDAGKAKERDDGDGDSDADLSPRAASGVAWATSPERGRHQHLHIRPLLPDVQYAIIGSSGLAPAVIRRSMYVYAGMRIDRSGLLPGPLRQ